MNSNSLLEEAAVERISGDPGAPYIHHVASLFVSGVCIPTGAADDYGILLCPEIVREIPILINIGEPGIPDIRRDDSENSAKQ